MDPNALAPVVATQDFSLFALFLRADIIVKTVMAILAVASVWSWAVAIDKWMTVGGAKSRAKRLENAFWSGQSMEARDAAMAGPKNRRRSSNAPRRRWTLR